MQHAVGTDYSDVGKINEHVQYSRYGNADDNREWEISVK